MVHMGTGGRLKMEAARVILVSALDGVTLRICDGDRIGLVGRNGAGKTTLLKIMAGIYEPTQGSVVRQGRVSSLLDLSLGMEEDATGYENIFRAGLMFGLKKRETLEFVPAIEEFTELGDYLSMPLRTYSSGMRMRLAFAVATSIRPEILLIDEVIGAGDAMFVAKANKRTEELVADSNILVLASHAADVIRKFCNRAVLLERGRIVCVGDVDDVLKTYDQRSSATA